MKWVSVCQYDALLSTVFMNETVSNNCTIGQLQASFHSLKLGRLLGEVGENYATQNILQFYCACRLNVWRFLGKKATFVEQQDRDSKSSQGQEIHEEGLYDGKKFIGYWCLLSRHVFGLWRMWKRWRIMVQFKPVVTPWTWWVMRLPLRVHTRTYVFTRI